MSALYLYDDARARTFEPFALTRPVSELRAGAELLRRRWEQALDVRCAGFIGAAHLADFNEPWAPGAASGELPAGSIVANSRCAISLAPAATAENVWVCDGEVAAVRLAKPLAVEALRSGEQRLASLAPTSGGVTAVAGRWLTEVWDLIGLLPEMLTEDIPALAKGIVASSGAPGHATVIGQHAVFVEAGATVEPMVVFDVAAGPVLIRKGATVQSFTRLVGPVYVGEGSTVTADRIACVSVGEMCKVHGEVSTSIFLGHANKGHSGFVGHSVLGRWVNLGASTVTSNLKNTYGSVAVWTPSGVRDSGLRFLGALFGDHVKTGIGLRLTTGCVLGAGANVFDQMPPKMVAPWAWGGGAPYGEYAIDKFLDVAERAMGRRQVELTAAGRRWLAAAHAARWQADA